jgi:two-component system chemotaxis response regulator CheY
MNQDEKANILIVDDSPTMRRMIKASLGSMPEVSFGEAGNGLEAIEQLAVASVSLMILDLNMPDMHGLEVLQFVRGHHMYERLPVIILTTRRDDSIRAQVLAGGATLYLTKPFTPQELIKHTRELLNARQQ